MDLSKTFDYIALDGTDSCMAALDEIRAGSFDNAFIEMSACKGSCISGPILREHAERPLTGVVKVTSYAGPADFDAKAPASMSEQFMPSGLRRVMPGSAAIQEVLIAMGKTSPDKELNCGCCGYPTCATRLRRCAWARPKLACACRSCARSRVVLRQDHLVDA